MAKTKSNKLGIEGIGRLEAEIMKTILSIGEPVTVRAVYEALRKKKSIAYTTVMTVMNNLANEKKKEVPLLEQDKANTAYVYKPTKTSVELATDLCAPILECFVPDRKTLTINA